MRRFADTPAILAAALAVAACSAISQGQQKTFKLDAEGNWNVSEAPEPGSDAEVIGRAREMIVQGRYAAAESLMDGWIERHERTSNPWLAEAYLARGDARLMRDREVPALEDYEEIVKNFPGSEAYTTALTRELDIGLRYLNGLRKRFLGLRIEPAERIGEEIVLRVTERMPRSLLGERALLELADYYYRVRDMSMASDAYEVFLRIYPNSDERQRAMQRRIYSNIAMFKGPRYDGSGLREARFLIQDYKARYPLDAERTGLDDALIARLDESAAVQMLESARWYLRRENPVSARLTVSRLLRRHPGTVAAVIARELAQEYGWIMPEPARSIGEAWPEEAAQSGD
ncbi:MAG TPA: outer membrane protein assembly factor BamD, partial [Phycisphaerales bacterium]|nr:outer membrane protein assembly factor BamD [Phycisphaerales bacterium]